MKNIKFTRLNIHNFRNINDLEINFNENVTEISGENGLGKTNTLSAIMWCLWGKNIDDNKQFVISPIIDNEERNDMTTSVKLVINGNYVIERSYYKRKTELKTGWLIDGKENLVSITQTNYQKELLENLVDEETFKSLSNINYIPNLNWKDLKKLIFELIGNIEDNEVLLRDNFDLIEEYVRKFGIEQTQKLLQETDKELSEDIKRLETEYQTLSNTKEKYVEEDKNLESLKERKKEIEKQLFDYETNLKKLKEQYEINFTLEKEVDTLQNNINNLKIKIDNNAQAIKDYEELYKTAGISVEELKAKDVKKIMLLIEDLGNEKAKLNRYIEDYKERIEAFKNKGNELKNKEIKVENETCSVCGQPLPEEKIKETLDKLKQQQLVDLENIKLAYDEQKRILNDYENDLKICEEKLHKANLELENVDKKEYVIEDETEKQKQIRVAKEQKEIENEQLKQEVTIKLIELNDKKEKLSNTEKPVIIEEDNLPLRLELDSINEKLATTITLGKINEDIDKSLNELNTKKDNKTLNKNKLLEVIKFNNVKADLLQQRVRNYFTIVNFKTKDYTLDGTEVETFKIVNDKGVEFKETNNGDKIALGLDLLQGVMKAKEIYLPILCDNAETFSGEFNVNNTQLIITRVQKGIKKLEVK